MTTSTTSRSHAVEQVAEAIFAGVLFSYAEQRRGRSAFTARIAGAALLVSAFAPAFLRRVRRAGAARRRVHLRTTLELDRPVHDVFAFCRDFENFPRVIQSLHNVTDFQDGRSHWEVMSPGGDILAWDAQVTKYVPNVVIAWRSLPGSVVACNGLIRFAPTARGGTRLQIQVEYDPRDTGLADAIRALFDTSRERQLEADLARANFYFTTHTRELESPFVEAESETSTPA